MEIIKEKVSVTLRGLMREKSSPFTWRGLFLKLFKTLELKLSPSEKQLLDKIKKKKYTKNVKKPCSSRINLSGVLLRGTPYFII